LIKLRCKQKDTNINYNSFCSWLGNAIEPLENYYFRHDSNKNPSYELAFQKTITDNIKQSKAVRSILTGMKNNLKELFVNKMKLQFKTLRKAFYELDRHRQGHITFDKFQVIISDWGFEAKENQVRSLFNWLDHDKDQKISFLDLRNSIGLEILPQEQFFFRQDVKDLSKITCKYEDCWENNSFNQKSDYCILHQKIIKNLTKELLAHISK
jgi:hypothetical protein